MSIVLLAPENLKETGSAGDRQRCHRYARVVSTQRISQYFIQYIAVSIKKLLNKYKLYLNVYNILLIYLFFILQICGSLIIEPIWQHLLKAGSVRKMCKEFYRIYFINIADFDCFRRGHKYKSNQTPSIISGLPRPPLHHSFGDWIRLFKVDLFDGRIPVRLILIPHFKPHQRSVS